MMSILFWEKWFYKDSRCDRIYTNIQLGQFSSIMTSSFVILVTVFRVILIDWIMVCWHSFENTIFTANKKFAKSSISSTFITFLLKAVLYSTIYTLAVLTFIISYSISESSKGLCIVISVWVKGRRKFPSGNSLFLVQTLMARFGIQKCVHWHIHTLFLFYMDSHTIVIYAVQEMYVLNYKHGHHIPI